MSFLEQIKQIFTVVTSDMTSVVILLIFHSISLWKWWHISSFGDSNSSWHQNATKFQRTFNEMVLWTLWNVITNSAQAQLLYHICCFGQRGKSIKHNFRNRPARIVISIKDDNDWPWIDVAVTTMMMMKKKKKYRIK